MCTTPKQEYSFPAKARVGAANGAPAHEPEVWDAAVAAFNPRFGQLPEPAPVAVSPALANEGSRFDIAEYLAEERGKDLLRFSTAGSVDDGKSTLIGRLLYDTQSVYDDQVRSIAGKGTTAPGVLDLALLTDGLRAEREGGITIDVAYRYFATSRRKFIIADTPGHEQYTRNMATGASTADAAIVLVDARKGVLPQSRRHASITALLGVRHVVVAVNKMDLVDWSEQVYLTIRDEFARLFQTLVPSAENGGQPSAHLHFLPVSALTGDNVVHRSAAMPWYAGPSLLALLESLPVSSHGETAAPFRLSVQRITRPNLDFRGFSGQIASGSIRPGDPVLVLPSGQRSRIASIVTFDGDLQHAAAPLSVTLTLDDEVDISRGDLLADPSAPAQNTSRFQASLVWMDPAPLELSRRYLLKQGSRIVQAQVRSLLQTMDLAGGATADETRPARDGESVSTLAMNGIGIASIETFLPVSVDLYAANRHTGSFILIDMQANSTVAAGMIRVVTPPADTENIAAVITPAMPSVTGEERAALWGHAGGHVSVVGSATLADNLERALLHRGACVLRLPPDTPGVDTLANAGALVLTSEEAHPEKSPALQLKMAGVSKTASVAGDLASALKQLGSWGLLRPEWRE